MEDTFTRFEVASLRAKAMATLEVRYPDDPTLALVRSLDRQLEAMDGQQCDTPSKEKIEKSNKGERKVLSAEDAKIERIANEAVAIFEKKLAEPTYARDVVPELRNAGVELPADDRGASSTVSQVFAKRPNLFKRFPGSSPSAVSKWHLKGAA